MPNCQQKAAIPYWQTVEFVPVLDGLVGMYVSDYDNNIIWTDRSTNGNNMSNGGDVVRASPIHSSNIFGSPFEYVSRTVNSYLRTINNPLNGLNSWTISMWIQFKGVINPDIYNEWQLMGIDFDGAVQFYYSSYNYITYNIGLPPGPTGVINYTLGSRTNNLIHVTVSTDATGSEMFIDGISFKTIPGTYTSNANRINIGRAFSGASGFIGTIDDVLIYNRKLTPLEANYNYTHSIGYLLNNSITL